MYFDRQRLNFNGWDNWTDEELIQILKAKIQYLNTHNKNYTKNQYILIDEVNAILEALQGD